MKKPWRKIHLHENDGTITACGRVACFVFSVRSYKFEATKLLYRCKRCNSVQSKKWQAKQKPKAH